MYLIENLGCKDIDKFLTQLKIKYSTDSDLILQKNSSSIYQLKLESYDHSKHKDTLIFWISHFKNQRSVSLDLFKL